MTWGSALCFATASLFDELMSAASLTTIAVVVIAEAMRAGSVRVLLSGAIYGLPALASAAFVVLAPGNYERARHSIYASAAPLENAITSLRQLSSLVVSSPAAKPFLLVWLGSAVCLAVLVGISRGWRVGALVAFGVSAAVLIGLSLPAPAGLIALAGGTACLMGCLYDRRHCVVALGLLLGAFATMVPLLASPGVAPRSLITFYCVLSVPLSWSVRELYVTSTRCSLVAVGVAVLVSMPALKNAREIYEGYASLYSIHCVNDRTFADAERAMLRGEQVPASLPYYRLPSTKFAEAMPYQRTEIEVWMRRYFRLPQTVKFEYRSASDPRLKDSAGYPGSGD